MNKNPITFKERLANIKSQTNDTMTCLQKDLIGSNIVDVINFDAMGKLIPSLIDDRFRKTENPKAPNGELLIGADENSTPSFFSNALICEIIATNLQEMSDQIIDVGKGDLSKTVAWGKRVLKANAVKIDWDSLWIKKTDPAYELARETDSIVAQVLDRDVDDLRELLDKIPNDAEGEKALIRDLIKMRLEDDKKYTHLLDSLRKIEDTKIITEVINSDAIKESDWESAIRFIGKQLIKLLETDDENAKKIKKREDKQ